MAKKWADEGAKFLHVVDLDGALEGELKNRDAIEEIIKNVSIPVQIGGGIRTIERIRELLGIGINRVILGTIAIQKPELVREAVAEFGGERIVVGIDAKNGKVAIKGWIEVTEKDAVELAKEMKKMGVKTIIYTDIAKDGMMEGVNLEACKTLAEEAGVMVVASGGVSSIDDIKKLKQIEASGIEGVITGKAIYEGMLNVAEAIKIAEQD
jgi:phosphoribosylformimino-5-aminoimidazole carboxamide ribotide isomerase